VAVYSQPKLVSASLSDYLNRHPNMLGSGKESMFLTTGDPRKVSDQATRFLRRKIEFRAA
jgi:glutamate racemase